MPKICNSPKKIERCLIWAAIKFLTEHLTILRLQISSIDKLNIVRFVNRKNTKLINCGLFGQVGRIWKNRNTRPNTAAACWTRRTFFTKKQVFNMDYFLVCRALGKFIFVYDTYALIALKGVLQKGSTTLFMQMIFF